MSTGDKCANDDDIGKEGFVQFPPPSSPHGATTILGQGLLIIKDSRSHSDTPHSAGLLWTSDQPFAETST